MTDAITVLPSDFQRRVLELPEDFDLFVGGGRGGGKSYCLALLILRFVVEYGAQARVLYLRQTYKGIADFELLTRDVFGKAYGTAARYNGAEHVWRFPNGGYVEFGQLEGSGDYSKYQGRSFALLIVDEAGQFAGPELLDMMRSNLRSSRGVPIRMVLAANPGGPGHHWILRRYIAGKTPWQPFIEEKSKRPWVHAPSTFRDNEFIDQAEYRAQLESSCPSDPELLRAWLAGDWNVARGAYFASCIDESRNAVGPFTEMPASIDTDRRSPTFGKPMLWDHWIAHDFGSSAPSVTYLIAESPGAEFEGTFYPRGSYIVVDELAAYRSGNLNQGLGWTASITAEAIIEFCDRWKVRARGVADDACFAKSGHGSGSLADEFARKGVRFAPAQKGDRITGWQRMRRLLADAGKPDVPGLYVSRSCEYFWSTVPFLPRDQKRIEDVDSAGPDHGADAMRYGLMRWRIISSVEPLRL